MRTSNRIAICFLFIAYFSSSPYTKIYGAYSAVLQSLGSEWQEYASGMGKFKVMLPGKPTTGYRPIGANSSVSVTYVTNLQIPPVAFIIDYFDLPTVPSSSSDLKQLLDETRDRAVRSYSMKVVDEKEITGMSYAGRLLKAKLPNNEMFLSKTLLVRQRVYQVAVVVPSDRTESSYVTKYFDSFRPVPLTDDEVKGLKSFSQAENEKATPLRIRFSEEVLQENATRKVQPSYQVTKAAAVSGEVKIEILISEQGQVIEAKVVSGPEQLHEAAMQAAKQWEFKPRTIEGRAVKVVGVLTFKFRAR